MQKQNFLEHILISFYTECIIIYYVTTESVTVENAFDVVEASSTNEEVFSLINSDLQFAVDNLQWTVTFGRVSKGTAKHVKAKVAMWQGDWA